MKKRTMCNERRFLNKEPLHSLSAVCGILKMEDSSPHWSPITGNFAMSDCSRTIQLDIDVETLEELENSIYKVEQIEQTASKLKKALIKSKPILKEWIESKKKNDENI